MEKIVFQKGFKVGIIPFGNSGKQIMSSEWFNFNDIVKIEYSENIGYSSTLIIIGRISEKTSIDGLVLDISEKFNSQEIIFCHPLVIRSIEKIKPVDEDGTWSYL